MACKRRDSELISRSVLLDDVLAAVDSQVARHVFGRSTRFIFCHNSTLIHAFPDQVIGPRGLLATKARLFVTHSISFLSRFDQLLYLRRGIIIESGSYAKLAGDKESHVYKLMSVQSGVILSAKITDLFIAMDMVIRAGQLHPEPRHLSGMVKGPHPLAAPPTQRKAL